MDRAICALCGAPNATELTQFWARHSCDGLCYNEVAANQTAGVRLAALAHCADRVRAQRNAAEEEVARLRSMFPPQMPRDAMSYTALAPHCSFCHRLDVPCQYGADWSVEEAGRSIRDSEYSHRISGARGARFDAAAMHLVACGRADCSRDEATGMLFYRWRTGPLVRALWSEAEKLGIWPDDTPQPERRIHGYTLESMLNLSEAKAREVVEAVRAGWRETEATIAKYRENLPWFRARAADIAWPGVYPEVFLRPRQVGKTAQQETEQLRHRVAAVLREAITPLDHESLCVVLREWYTHDRIRRVLASLIVDRKVSTSGPVEAFTTTFWWTVAPLVRKVWAEIGKRVERGEYGPVQVVLPFALSAVDGRTRDQWLDMDEAAVRERAAALGVEV